MKIARRCPSRGASKGSITMPQLTYEEVLSQIKALPPEDATRLREYLNAQSQQDREIENARTRARTCATRDLSAEYQWIKVHRAEYAGQWVALKGDQLISHGPRGVEVMDAARQVGHPDAFFKLIVPAEDLQYSVF
jgi:hypothetical protein